MTFYGQLHLLPVRRQLPCSDGFACLRSHPILVNRTGASLKVVVVAGSRIVLRRCSGHLARLSPGLYSKGGCARIYIFGAAASYHGLKAVLSKEFAEHENEAVKL